MLRKANPFDKYLSKEDRLQRACCNYLNLQYPNVLYTHPANEGKRTPFEQYKALIMGMKAGIPDLLIFESAGSYKGLAIEFKIGKNKPTVKQMQMSNKLTDRGWLVKVIYSLDEFIELVTLYFSNKLVISE